MLSRLIITFLPRSKRLLLSWLQSPAAVILEPKKIKSATVSTVSPSISHEVMGPDVMILVFWMLSFKPTFPLSSFTFIKSRYPKSGIELVSRFADRFFAIWATREALSTTLGETNRKLSASSLLWKSVRIPNRANRRYLYFSLKPVSKNGRRWLFLQMQKEKCKT